MGRVGAAAAAAAELRELAGAAASTELGVAQVVEHRRAAPQIVEGPFAQVPRRHRHVRARRDVALGRDSTIVLPGRTRAVGVVHEERRGRVHLVEDAPEVRRALGADQQPVGAPDRQRPRVLELLRRAAAQPEHPLHERRRSRADTLRARQVRQDAFVRGGVDVGEVSTATGPHQEEEVQHLGAKLLREVDHRGDLGDVPVGHRHVQGEIEAGVGQHAGRPHRSVPGAGQMTERVVLHTVGRIQTDRSAEHTVLAHAGGFLLTQQEAVRSEHGREPLLGSVRRHVPNVLPQQWLAARQDQEHVRIDPRNLVHHPPALVGPELPPRIGPSKRRHVAVRALEIAALSQIPRHAIRRIPRAGAGRRDRGLRPRRRRRLRTSRR